MGVERALLTYVCVSLTVYVVVLDMKQDGETIQISIEVVLSTFPPG